MQTALPNREKTGKPHSTQLNTHIGVEMHKPHYLFHSSYIFTYYFSGSVAGLFFSVLSAALKTVKHPDQRLKSRQGLAPAWLHKALSFKQLSKLAHPLLVIWSTMGIWCAREIQGETHKKNRQGANKVWVVLVRLSPQLTCDTGELLDSGGKSFTYCLLWGKITIYSVLKQWRTSLYRVMPASPMPKCTQGEHKPACSDCQLW